ncbi:hypothetical protein Pfo_031649 [Paulownia fortunei]|nr:hypothetical protein Pfo_031649 [Paulownia fortunei]
MHSTATSSPQREHGAHERRDGCRRVGRAEQVAEVHEARDVVPRALGDQVPGVADLDGVVGRVGDAERGVDGRDVVPGAHRLAEDPVAGVEGAAGDAAALRVDGVVVLDQTAELLGAHRLAAGVRVATEQPDHAVRGLRQHPDHRRIAVANRSRVGATAIEKPSARCRARRFGTSSPNTSDRATASAAPWRVRGRTAAARRPARSTTHRTRRENPATVTPICTADRKRFGSRPSAATRAPREPRRSSCCSCDSRSETRAISAAAKTPPTSTKRMTSPKAIQVSASISGTPRGSATAGGLW